jgi:hypothetical protein
VQSPMLTAEEIAARCRCAPFTVVRWCRAGVRGIRLRGQLVGGKWLVAEDDLAEFIAATTAKSLGPAAPPAAEITPAPAERKRRAAEARERMRAEKLL